MYACLFPHFPIYSPFSYLLFPIIPHFPIYSPFLHLFPISPFSYLLSPQVRQSGPAGCRARLCLRFLNIIHHNRSGNNGLGLHRIPIWPLFGIRLDTNVEFFFRKNVPLFNLQQICLQS